jgi:hypothetical protein
VQNFAIELIYIENEDPGERDAKLFHVMMRVIGSYAASPNTLLLYYYFDGINYLLFTKQES